MKCVSVIVSGVAGVGKRVDQSQNTSLQVYIFGKQEDSQKWQTRPFLDVLQRGY